MLYWICFFLVVLPLVIENVLLRRWRNAVPLRIHVHGTRGKTSTVRSLAEALSRNGHRVLAKTTGDSPQYILPDGSRRGIRRWAPAHIKEQVDVLRHAARLGVDVAVVEGMALQPETVFQSEQILRATHAVVVNTRPDHPETMGAGRRGVLRTLSLMLPELGRVYTARESGAAILCAYADASGIPCSIVSGPTPQGQPEALAAAVAAEIGTGGSQPQTCGAGTVQDHGAPHDDGPVEPYVALACAGVSVRFLDLFSVNDIVSARLRYRANDVRGGINCLCVALLATRADRPLRTRAFMDWIVSEPGFDAIVPVGSHAWYALVRTALAKPEARDRLHAVAGPWTGPQPALKRLCRFAQKRGFTELTIVGLGNVHGFGERWRRLIAQKGAS